MLNFRNLFEAKSSSSLLLPYPTMGFASRSTDLSTGRSLLIPLFGFSENPRKKKKNKQTHKWKRKFGYGLRDFPDHWDNCSESVFVVADRFGEVRQEQSRLCMVLSNLYALCNDLPLTVRFQFIPLCIWNKSSIKGELGKEKENNVCFTGIDWVAGEEGEL